MAGRPRPVKLTVSLVCFLGDHDQLPAEQALLDALAKIPGVEMVRVDSREAPAPCKQLAGPERP